MPRSVPSPRTSCRNRLLDERARAMRLAPTASEALLFDALRGGRLGVRVRRQVPLLGRYIADFLLPDARLVIEVDGPYHDSTRAADERRDRALRRAGFHVLRLAHHLVIADLDRAVETVRECLRLLPRE